MTDTRRLSAEMRQELKEYLRQNTYQLSPQEWPKWLKDSLHDLDVLERELVSALTTIGHQAEDIAHLNRIVDNCRKTEAAYRISIDRNVVALVGRDEKILNMQEDLAAAQATISKLEKLAYIGDHHFEDNTYKARLDELVPQFREAQATITQLQEKCEKIPGYMAEREAHRTLLMERDAVIAAMLPMAKFGMEASNNPPIDLGNLAQLAAAHDASVRAPLEAKIAALVAEIRGIAEESILPDGDGVTVPVALWAESVLERLAALAAYHTEQIRAEAYEAGRADEKAAQQAAYWADQKMPRQPA